MNKHYMFSKYFPFLFALASLLSLSWETLIATTYVVHNTNDAGTGSFRHAINKAQNGDTIIFQHHLSGPINLKRPLPIINNNLTIIGNGQIQLNGQHQHQVLFINSGTVVIRNLTIENGLSQGGNGGCSFSGNGGGALGSGGGLFVNNDAIVILSDITFKHNVAQGGCGGCLENIYNCGAGGGGGGGMNSGNGGSGSFNFNTGSGGGGGGGLNSLGGIGFAAGGGGAGFTGTLNNHLVSGNGNNAGLLHGGAGGNGTGGHNTGGNGGINDSIKIDGLPGDPYVGGGGGGGGASTTEVPGGNGGNGGAIGGGGGGGGGYVGGSGGNGGDFGGGGGGGGSINSYNLCTNDGGHGGFGGGGGGGGGCCFNSCLGGKGGNGGFGGGGGGGGKNALGGHSLHGGGSGGNNDGGGGGGAGYGGAVFIREFGVVVMKNVTFCSNKALGGSGCKGGTDGEGAGNDIYFVETGGCHKRNEIQMTANGVISHPLHNKFNQRISIHDSVGRTTIHGDAQEDSLIIHQAALLGNQILQDNFHEQFMDIDNLTNSIEMNAIGL